MYDEYFVEGLPLTMFQTKYDRMLMKQLIRIRRKIKMEISTLGSVVGIVMICYGIGLGCKASEKIPDKRIPVIMMICGGVLGIIGLYTMPGYPATDIINAIAVGMFNGLAATGVNQLYKQQSK